MSRAATCTTEAGGGVPTADPSLGPDAGATCGRCFPATTMPLGVRSRICHTRS